MVGGTNLGETHIEILNLPIGLQLGEFDVVDEDIRGILTDGLIGLLIAGTEVQMNMHASLGQRIKMMKTGLCRFVLGAVFTEI
jgi:hypothetical protein